MMSFLDEVRADREDLARVLKKHKGIRRTVEELYPDTAHFIYELLQNAEDTKATEATFILNDLALIFEHNGRPFSERDILAITDIGEGTKAEDDNKIGRFGVGFKAVFAYTETPRIWSPTFSFEISDLVLPTEIAATCDLGASTRFEFPFNNAKKPPHDAHADVLGGLEELAETTLLFLSHLESIRWQVGETSGEVLRVPHTENYIEVLKQTDGKTTSASHFLRFTQPVRGIEKQRIAIAFALDQMPNATAFDPNLPLAKQLRIVPANPGRVAVSFPCIAESSGLRFHFHAPFITTADRATVKDTPTNAPLFEELAELSASALTTIRDLELLTGEFLSVLPNPQDAIPPRYQPIRAAILAEMNNKPLTPTQAKSHAAAKNLLQAKAALKELLSPEDVEFLVDYTDEPPQWAISAAQKNSNADRFLAGLAIRNWDTEEFVERIEGLSHVKRNSIPDIISTGRLYAPFDADLAEWFAGKSLEWHQRFYALLYHEFSPDEDWDRIEPLLIVRLSDGSYKTGKESYFPSETTKSDELLPRVNEAVYSSGRSKTQQEAAKKLLEAIGVREVGEVEQVQAILDQRYSAPSIDPRQSDLKRFIALVEKEPTQSKLFAKYYIFERVDGKWGTPAQVFLDSPFLETGLTLYHDTLGDKSKRKALSASYADLKIPPGRIRKFAEAVGAQTQLEICEADCSDNPQWTYLCGVGGERNTSPINQDFTILELKRLLSRASTELSKLVWRTMCSLPRNPNRLVAKYQRNETHGYRVADSQLVHTLRHYAWVPQTGDRFARPAEANSDKLPEGFAFDPGYEWIKKVQFGECNRQRAEENANRESTAKELGFSDAEALERAKKFAALPKDKQERILADSEGRRNPSFPDHEPRDPDFRRDRVGQQAEDAPDRKTEQRTQSVSVGREAVKEQTLPYLRAEYTNPNGEMFCQACKAVMPFKLDDGSFYFEMVEFLPKLRKRHYQNYLALCPNHAAMFQHANGSEDLMRSMFLDLTNTELEVVLAQEDTTIQFTKTHIADLKAVIEADESPKEADALPGVVASQTEGEPFALPADKTMVIQVHEPITIAQLALLLEVKPFQLISELMKHGAFMSIRDTLSREQVEKMASKWGYSVHTDSPTTG